MQINTYHGGFNRSVRRSLSDIKYFTVHYTGSMACAKNNCLYFASGNRYASADLFIDRDGTIWEYNNILDGHYSWHCGDGGGKRGITNANSMGIEVVSDGRDFTDAQIAAISELYHHYCQVLGRTLTVVRHYDASRKSCPKPYVAENKWAALKSRIINDYEEDDGMKPSDVIERPDGHRGTLNDILAYVDMRCEAIEPMVRDIHEEVMSTDDNDAGHGADSGARVLDRITWIEGQQKCMVDALNKFFEEQGSDVRVEKI